METPVRDCEFSSIDTSVNLELRYCIAVLSLTFFSSPVSYSFIHKNSRYPFYTVSAFILWLYERGQIQNCPQLFHFGKLRENW
jgi:hypothetical protein